MLGHRISLHGDMVDNPAQVVCKARLDKALSHLIKWQVPLHMAGGLGLHDL